MKINIKENNYVSYKPVKSIFEVERFIAHTKL